MGSLYLLIAMILSMLNPDSLTQEKINIENQVKPPIIIEDVNGEYRIYEKIETKVSDDPPFKKIQPKDSEYIDTYFQTNPTP